MFGMMLTTVVTLLHLYVFWRVSTVPFITDRVPRKFIFAAGAVTWAAFLLARFLEHGSTGSPGRLLDLFGMNWMAALFLVATALLAADLITGFGFLAPRVAPTLRGWALAAGGVLVVIALVQGIRPPVVRDYEVRLTGLPAAMDGTLLVVVSDLHLGSLLGEEWLAGRVAQVEALRPDLVVLLGDLVEGHGRPEGDFLPGLRRLAAPLGVWAVTGNHESHGGTGGPSLLEEAGFRVLHDRWEEVRPGFILAGVDDLTSRRRTGGDAAAVDHALAGRPPGATLLFSHSPLQVERAAQDGVGLMLSGHTHGGQIWPFGWLVRLTNPFVAGRYEVGAMTAIVSRGAGTWGPRMRLWYPGEILRVTLRTLPPG